MAAINHQNTGETAKKEGLAKASPLIDGWSIKGVSSPKRQGLDGQALS